MVGGVWSAVWKRNQAVEARFGGEFQFELFHLSCKATLARVAPALNFGDHHCQRESRQEAAQGFQHADDNRLSPSAAERFVRAVRFAHGGGGT